MSEKPVPLEELLGQVQRSKEWVDVDEMAARLRAVAALHQPEPILHSKNKRCRYCSSLMSAHLQEIWPCPTARALAGEREER